MNHNLRMFEENGSGTYYLRMPGIVFSLGAVLGILSLVSVALIRVGNFETTLHYTTDRTAAALLKLDRHNERMTRLELDINTIKIMLQERERFLSRERFQNPVYKARAGDEYDRQI